MSSDDIKSAAVGAAKPLAHEAAEAASATGSQAADRAKGAASTASQAAGDMLGRAKEQVQSLSDNLPGSASDAYQAGQRVLSQGGGQVSRQVVKQPIEALLLAGAIGYLVGWATSRS